MAYSEKYYERAKKILESRRLKAENDAKIKHDEITAICPELEELEKELSKAGLEAIKAIGMGEDAQKFIEELAAKNLKQQAKRKELLQEIGIEPDALDVKYTCQKCEDKGVYKGKRCECFNRLLKQIAYEEICKCSPIELSSFESFKLDYYPNNIDSQIGLSQRDRMEQIYNYCRQWADDFDKNSPSVLMYGATGLGKTHLSLAMARVAIEKGYGVVYGSTQNFLNRLEKEHFGRQNDDTQTEQMLLECDLLILDDLGAEFSTAFTVSALYNLINTRMLTGLPTIISTNLELEELEEKYTQRITSRIIGSYTPLMFCGKDIRQLRQYNTIHG